MATAQRTSIIVDLDGTLANVDHRRALINGANRDWKAFHEACIDDPPNEWCVRIVSAMRSAGCSIEFVSARAQNVEHLSRRWLEKHFGGDLSKMNLVLLKPHGAVTKDVELKRDWLRSFGKDKILFAVDDRARVVRMWREEGIVCLQCDDWEERETAAAGIDPGRAVNPDSNAQTDQQAPMGAHPPQAPRLTSVLVESYKAVQPPGFRDHAESSVEAADFEVEDTIGGE